MRDKRLTLPTNGDGVSFQLKPLRRFHELATVNPYDFSNLHRVPGLRWREMSKAMLAALERGRMPWYDAAMKAPCYEASDWSLDHDEGCSCPDAEIAMRMLDQDGARRVQAWFSYLERWDTDEVERRNSPQLPEMPGVYVMRTTTEIRIFFRVDGDTVTILDVTKKAAF